MKKDERAIIDKFLEKTPLYFTCGGPRRAKSIAAIEEAKKQWESELAKDKVAVDLAMSYKNRISKKLNAGDLLADLALDLLGKIGPYGSVSRYPHDMAPDEYESLLRLIRVLGDALAKEFPAETDEKGA